MKETIYYRCNPKENTECRKSGCFIWGGRCRATSRAEYALKDDDGHPIEEFRVRDQNDGTD